MITSLQRHCCSEFSPCLLCLVPAEHGGGGIAAPPSVSLLPAHGAGAGRWHGVQAPPAGLPQRQVLPLHRQLLPAGRRGEEEERRHPRHHGQDRWVWGGEVLNVCEERGLCNGRDQWSSWVCEYIQFILMVYDIFPVILIRKIFWLDICQV